MSNFKTNPEELTEAFEIVLEHFAPILSNLLFSFSKMNREALEQESQAIREKFRAVSLQDENEEASKAPTPEEQEENLRARKERMKNDFIVDRTMHFANTMTAKEAKEKACNLFEALQNELHANTDYMRPLGKHRL